MSSADKEDLDEDAVADLNSTEETTSTEHDIEEGTTTQLEEVEPIKAPETSQSTTESQLDDLNPVPPPNGETPKTTSYECCICYEMFSSTSGSVHGCTGSMGTHYRCNDCELSYLQTELAPGYAFDSRRFMGGDEESGGAAVSEPGQLPCPLFVPGNCDCGAIPLAGLCDVLRRSEKTAKAYHEAFRRVVEAQVRRELPHTQDTRVPSPSGQSTVQEVHQAVMNYLNEGSIMTCPDCGFPGLKDHACMHIVCRGSGCSTRWCYCCGRRRFRAVSDNPEGCKGCDALYPRLEEHYGWKNFALPGELPGEGACNEFHRRKIRYYVKHEKERANPSVWADFRKAYPTILTDVPTTGRSIAWDELDDPTAAVPPLFGNTTEEDLLWKLPQHEHGAAAERHTRSQSPPRRPNQQEQEQIQLPSLGQVLSSIEGQLWIVAFIVACILLVVRWSFFDSPVFTVITDILVTAPSYGLFAFLLLRAADECALSRLAHAHVLIPECLLLGTEQEPPFLSQVGRWSEHRDVFVRFFVGGTALGSLMVSVSGHIMVVEVTFRVMGSIVLALVLADLILLTVVVNHSTPPPIEDDHATGKYRAFKKLLFGMTLCWAIGIGLATCDTYPAHPTGLILLSSGLAGIVAEMFPRLLRSDGQSIWAILDTVPHLLSYAVFIGCAVGPTLVHIGNSGPMVEAARIVGILLCAEAPLSGILWFLAEQRNRLE